MISAINDTGFANILTVVMVIVTAVYVFLTWRIANSNKVMLESVEAQHLEEIRPNVFAHLEFREQTVARLVIENLGKTPAYSLRCTLDREFYQFANSSSPNMQDMAVFNEVIDWFPPGARIILDLAQGFNFDVEKDGRNLSPSKFCIGLKYESRFLSYDEKCFIDLTPYMNMHVAKTASEQLGKIEEHLKRMAKS